MAKQKTPWLGVGYDSKTRPVQSNRPTARQVADTVLQEMRDPGYMVSFYSDDAITTDEALSILSKAVIRYEKQIETIKKGLKE